MAKNLFARLYKQQDLPIYDVSHQVRFQRKMRAYLVKDEATLEQLANQKFD
jgi:hypothetical protein